MKHARPVMFQKANLHDHKPTSACCPLSSSHVIPQATVPKHQRRYTMLKSLNRPLAEVVDAKYAAAKASESLAFAPSSLSILHTESQLPVCEYRAHSTEMVYLCSESSNYDTAHLWLRSR